MSVVYDEQVIEKTQLKEPPKYNIWAIDNDYTAFEEVVIILMGAFGMNALVAAELTLQVDSEGKAKVNPKPMPKGIAQALLNKVNNIKRDLAKERPRRKQPIMMLKFVIKED